MKPKFAIPFLLVLAICLLAAVGWRYPGWWQPYLPQTTPTWLTDLLPPPQLAAGTPLDNTPTSQIDVLTPLDDSATVLPPAPVEPTTDGTSHITVLDQPTGNPSPETAVTQPSPLPSQLATALTLLHSAQLGGDPAEPLRAAALALANQQADETLQQPLALLAETPPVAPTRLMAAVSTLHTLAPPVATVSAANDPSATWWYSQLNRLVKVNRHQPPNAPWQNALADARTQLDNGNPTGALKALQQDALANDPRLDDTRATLAAAHANHAIWQTLLNAYTSTYLTTEGAHP